MKPEVKTAVILGGGLATFDSFSIAACPKFLLPMANRPLYHYLAAGLARVGVERLIFCVTPGLEKRWKRNWPASRRPANTWSRNHPGQRRLSEGSRAWIKDGPFWVAGGDLLLDEDLSRMLAFHQARGAGHGRLLAHPEAPWEMERVEMGAAKDQGHSPASSLPGKAQHPEARRPLSLRAGHPGGHPGGQVFRSQGAALPALYERGAPSAVWEIQGYCRTITSMDDYFFANQDVLLGRVQFPESSGSSTVPAPGGPQHILPLARAGGDWRRLLPGGRSAGSGTQRHRPRLRHRAGRGY